MTEEEAKQRFAAARVARLATVTPANDPHIVPICFAVDGDTIFSAVDAKPKRSPDLKRLRNIGAHPSVTLLVDHYDDDDWTKVWWVRVDGHGTVIDDGPQRDRGLELLTAKYSQYRGSADLLGRIVVVEAVRWRFWAYAGGA
jgi:PPOX class probable F420-dependent enzyme